MSNFGHFQVPRSLLSDPLWKSLSYQYRHVFLTVLQNMAFKEIEMDDFGVLTKIQPFQLLTTKSELTKLCNEPDIDESLVYRSILKLEKLRFWNHKTNHRKTIITIVREDVLRTREPSFEPNSNQTRTKLEPQKNNDNNNNNEQENKQPTPTPSTEAPGSGVLVYGCLVGLVFSETEKVRLSQEFSEVDLIRAVGVLKEQKRKINDPVAFLIKAIREKYQPRKPVSFELSARGKNNKETILKFKETFSNQLSLKDIEIVDRIDHVLFNNEKIFYESDSFGKEVSKILEKLNLSYLVKKPQIPPPGLLQNMMKEQAEKMKLPN